MIDKICMFLTKKIRKEMPEINDERAEIINYGLQNIIGEMPKVFLMLAIAYILGIFNLALFTFLAVFLYKGASGGIHMKSHLGCIIFTIMFYCLIPFVSRYFVLVPIIKYISILLLWIFGMFMIKLYAPADTEDVPILNKEDRKRKKRMSYITFTVGLIIAMIIRDSTLCNILILSYFIQTLTITKLAYRLSNNKHGYEVYGNTSVQSI